MAAYGVTAGRDSTFFPLAKLNSKTNPKLLSPVAKRTRSTKVKTGTKSSVNIFSSYAASTPESPYSQTTSSGGLKRKISEVDNDSADVSPYAVQTKSPGARQNSVKTGKTGKKAQKKEPEEKRGRKYRSNAPKSFLEKLERAQTQRMIVIGRKRVDTEACLTEEIDIVGSTGNIYKVTVGQLPSCTCPDHSKGNECKHKVYALHTVLKAPDHLQYQLAYLSDELREIFTHAPPIPTDIASSNDKDGKRKPVEGECPICYMDFEEEQNELVWCKAACGNNMHKSCFDQWAASQRGTTVKCVYCRTPWQIDPGDFQEISKAGTVNEEGYVNVAEHFGMTRARDYSSYHQPWVRRTFGYGM